jgi:DNA repair protein SbcC/Rad50
MQLRRLEVTNIRSFESGRLDLGPGTTLLVGDVGAGKSSLLYAVEMALFGVAEVDAAFLVRHGTAHAEVGVTLEDAEHRYAIRRRFRKVRRRGRETFEPERLTFAEDGRQTAYSATEIRQRVIELLGFPDNPNPHAHSDLWRWAIYVPQERMREILAVGAEERLETVRKALGVERYRTAAENAQVVAADLRASARRRREEVARMAHWDVEFAETTREADRLRLERQGVADRLAAGERGLEAAREARQRAEADVGRHEADRRELEALQREAAADERRVADARRRTSELQAEERASVLERESLRPLAAREGSLRADRETAEAAVRTRREAADRRAVELQSLARAETALGAAQRRLAELGERERHLGTQREAAEAARKRLEETGPTREPPAPTPRSVAEIDAALTAVVTAEHAAVDRLARARAALDQVEELLRAGVCPTCEQPVRAGDFAGHRDEAARAVAAGEAEKAARSDERGRLEEERKARERYERSRERWVELEARRREARDAVAGISLELTRLGEQTSAGEADRAKAASEVERLRPLSDEHRREQEALAAAERELHALAEEERRAAAATERTRTLEAIAVRLTEEAGRLATEVQQAGRRHEERGPRLRLLEAGIAGAVEAEAALAWARTAEAEAEGGRAEARAALVRADTRLDALVERLAAAERGRAERALLAAEAVDLDAKAEWLGEPFRVAVLRMERQLLAHAQVAFDRAFSRFFGSLVDDPMIVARTDVSFTPEVTIAGVATPAEALSGGERTSLALAFRLALASVVRSLGAVRLETLLLDEPTDGFSSEQVVRMGELLDELALPQVVVVSHESQLAGIADRTVRVVKADGRSTLTPDRPGSLAGSGEQDVGPGDEELPEATGPAPRAPARTP